MQTLVTMIACLASFGCGDATASKPAPLPPVSDFAISFHRDGGFAPTLESLIVTPGRNAVARSSGSRAGERRVRFRIDKGRVRALQTGLRAAGFASIRSESKTTCSDCYFYAIRYRGHTVDLVEPDVPPRLGEVIDEIESVISTRTIPPNF